MNKEIIHFIAGRRDRKEMRYIADRILCLGDASSEAIINIYINHDLKLEDMASLLYEGLESLNLLLVDTAQEATLCIICEISSKMIAKKVSYYDGFCQMREVIKEYNELENMDDYFGKTISLTLSELLWKFDIDEDFYASETVNGSVWEKSFNQDYENSNIDEVLKSLCKENRLNLLDG